MFAYIFWCHLEKGAIRTLNESEQGASTGVEPVMQYLGYGILLHE